MIYEYINLSWAWKDHSPARAEMKWLSVHHWEDQFHPQMNCFQKEQGEEEEHSLGCYLRVDGWHSHHFHIKHSPMVVDPFHTRERNLERNNTTMKQLLSEEKDSFKILVLQSH